MQCDKYTELDTNADNGGFDWETTLQGYEFWANVDAACIAMCTPEEYPQIPEKKKERKVPKYAITNPPRYPKVNSSGMLNPCSEITLGEFKECSLGRSNKASPIILLLA
jgi:hypothetical protein